MKLRKLGKQESDNPKKGIKTTKSDNIVDQPTQKVNLILDCSENNQSVDTFHFLLPLSHFSQRSLVPLFPAFPLNSE